MSNSQILIVVLIVLLFHWNFTVKAIWKCDDNDPNQVSSSDKPTTQPSSTTKKPPPCDRHNAPCTAASASACCSGICKPTNFCDCLRNGQHCEKSSSCCTGNCQLGKKCGCTEDGKICFASPECCGGFCLKAKGDKVGNCTKCRGEGEKCLDNWFDKGITGCCNLGCLGNDTCGVPNSYKSSLGQFCNDASDCQEQGLGIITLCECDSVGLNCQNFLNCCSGLGINTCNTITKKFCVEPTTTPHHTMEQLRQSQVINLGYDLYILPFYEPNPPATYVVKFDMDKQRMIKWRLTLVCHIVSRLLYFGVLGPWYDLNTAELNEIERLLHYFLTFAISISTSCQCCSLFYSKKLASHHNNFVRLQSRLRMGTKTGLSLNKLDSIELIVNLINWCAISVTIAAFPVFSMGIHFNLHALALLNTGYLPISMCIGLYMAYCIMIDWVFVIYYLQHILIYCHAVCNFLQLYSWSPNAFHKTQLNMPKLIQSYWALQIYHYMAMQDVNQLICLILALASALMIVGLTVVILFYKSISLFILISIIGAFLVSIIGVSVILNFVAKLTKLSAHFRDSYLKNELCLSKMQKMQLKSCRPLYVPVGSFLYVQNTTFPVLMSDLVVANTISLILAFR